MKKLLLLSITSAITLSSYGQSFQKISSQVPVKINISANKVNLLSGAKTTGSTIVKDTSLAYIKDSSQVIIDSLYPYYIDKVLPVDSGYVFGTNIFNYLGAAESYPFNHVINANDTAWEVIGVAGIWGGTVQPTSTNKLTYKVWSIDTNIVPSPIPGAYDLIGLPGAALDSVTVNFTSLNASTGNFGTGWFSTPLSNLQSGVYAGYEMTTPFSSVVGSGDTIVLGATRIRSGNPGDVTDKDFYNVFGGDTAVITRGAYQITPGLWYDFAYDLGYNVYLSIFPVVKTTAITGVKGLSNNNLTFFGNYPNPANANTNIKFALSSTSDVTITIADMAGRVIKNVQQSALISGEHTVSVNTADLAVGNYLYVIRTNRGGVMASQLTVKR